jgi:hypothetical protein
VPKKGFMGGSIDRRRGLLYYSSDPDGALVRFDLATRKVFVSEPVALLPRYTAIDPNGVFYMTGKSNTFVRCRPGEDKVDVLPLELPRGQTNYAAPYTVAISADGKELLGIPIGGGPFQHYDIANPRAKRLRVSFGPPCAPAEMKGLDVHCGVLGKDGCFYYVVASNNQGYVGRYDLRARQVSWVKKLVVTNRADDKVQYSQGAAVSADGTLWLMFIYPQRIVGLPGLTKAGK